MEFSAPAVFFRVGKIDFCQGFCVLLLVLTSSCATQPRLGSSPGLQKLVNSALARFPGHAGVYVKHLKTGEEAGFRADELFNSASVIKLPVAAHVLEKTGRGDLNLDKRIPFRKADVRGGSGVLQFHDLGLQPTLRDIIFQMIIASDNSATDVAIERAGGVAAVNAWVKSNGYESLHLIQTAGDCFAKFSTVFAGLDPGAQSPEALRRAADATEPMRKKVIGDRDYARSGPIVVAFCANSISGNHGDAEDHIGRFAQKVVEYFDRTSGQSR